MGGRRHVSAEARRETNIVRSGKARGGDGDKTVARVRDDGCDKAARNREDGRKSGAREGHGPRVVAGTGAPRRSQGRPRARPAHGAHYRGPKEESAVRQRPTGTPAGTGAGTCASIRTESAPTEWRFAQQVRPTTPPSVRRTC